MKSIIRLIILVLLCSFLAGGMTSCAVFDNSSAIKQKSFKHKDPLPKKWIIPNKSRDIVK